MQQTKQRKTDYRALCREVLAVAVEGQVKDWACYIGSVLGNNHREEWEQVRSHGCKQSRRIAEVLFPNFKHLTYRD